MTAGHASLWDRSTCSEHRHIPPTPEASMCSKAAAAIALLVALVLADAQAADTRVDYSAIQYLKNFALSACIAQGYTADEVVTDSRAAAGGYLELGSMSHEA